jgi:hypothetical protein
MLFVQTVDGHVCEGLLLSDVRWADVLVLPRISIATNTGWVFNTRFLLYLIHSCVVFCTNNTYWAQCAHSDAAMSFPSCKTRLTNFFKHTLFIV